MLASGWASFYVILLIILQRREKEREHEGIVMDEELL